MTIRQSRMAEPSAGSVSDCDSVSPRIVGTGLQPTLSACLFWALCLTLTAAGHRVYKSIVIADRHVSSERYRHEGAPLVWTGHGTPEHVYRRITGTEVEPTELRLFALPISSFWLAAIAALTALAGFIAWCGQYVKNDGLQSLLGLFAGHCLWLGAVEFGLDAVGRRLGLSGSLDTVDGRIVGTHGSGILIQMSAVFLVPVLLGLTLHESNRCAMFQWIRNRLPLTRLAAASGRVDNYAARTTMQYFLTVWFCYVAVLWLADPVLGQAGGMLLLAAMAGILCATPYMIWRTAQQLSVGHSLRYSVSGAVVTWTGIEIAASMQLFDEPWLSSSTSSGLFFAGLTILLTAVAVLQLVKRPLSSRVSRSLATLLMTGSILCVSGCSAADEPRAAASPDEIAASLREFDKQIAAPTEAAHDGLLHALASADPEFAAQAAVAFGKAIRVSPAVKQQLEVMAVSDDASRSQMAALLALSRLGLLTQESEAVLQRINTDETWDVVAALFTH